MNIEQNCLETSTARDAALTLAKQVLTLAKEEYDKLPSDRARQMFLHIVHDAMVKRMDQKPPCATATSTTQPQAEPQKPAQKLQVAVGNDKTADAALELVEEIESMAENMPSAASDFTESVLEKAKSIAETVESRGFATGAQLTALENMLDGMGRWMR